MIATSITSTYASGLVFCIQPMLVAGKPRQVITIRKPNNGSPIYVIVNAKHRNHENLIGCAVLAMEHIGIDRPRLQSILRVAGAIAKLAA